MEIVYVVTLLWRDGHCFINGDDGRDWLDMNIGDLRPSECVWIVPGTITE